MTLYDFQRDTATKSACYGTCAKIWPPLMTSGAPKAGGGAQAAKLGTIKRTDGKTQVTYDGHPLYTYTADMSPGETSGNGITSFGGSWHTLGPSGSEANSLTGGGIRPYIRRAAAVGAAAHFASISISPSHSRIAAGR